MKKNLRIVSAAAAALLAVAPVAAAGVAPVSAAAEPSTTVAGNHDYHQINLGGSTVTQNNNTVDITPSFTLNGANKNIPGSLTGSISATLGGTSFTSNLRGTAQDNVKVYVRTRTGANGAEVTNWKNVSAKKMYNVVVDNVGFNFGAANAGKTVTFASSNRGVVLASNGQNPALTVSGNKITTKLDQNGTTYGLRVTIPVTAFDTTNTNDVLFYDIASGNRVTAGNAMVLANAQGKLNIASLLPAVNSNYTAVQLENGANNNGNGNWSSAAQIDRLEIKAASDIKAQLKAQNIDVDANGFFTAPHSFKLNVEATSNVNGKHQTLPVTFTVANVAEATVASQSKPIMHAAYLYDKNGKRVGTDVLHAYNSVTIATKTTKIGNKNYYELIKDGKNSGQFIAAGNIDGSSRTLKHNAYVYNTKGHRVKSEGTWKKGTSHTTYGAVLNYRGHKMYRVAQYRYVKAANF